MSLHGKSLFASAMIHGSLVAVMAGVVFLPGVKTNDAAAGDAGPDSFCALVIEAPAAPATAEPDIASVPPEMEIAPPVIESAGLDLVATTLPAQPAVLKMSAPASIGALPAIASAPVRGTAPRASGKAGARRDGGGGGGAAGHVYTPAKYLSTPRPRFPASITGGGVTALIIFSVSIDAGGRTIAVTLRKSCGRQDVDACAERAVRDWRFSPARLDGVAVPARLEVPIRLALK